MSFNSPVRSTIIFLLITFFTFAHLAGLSQVGINASIPESTLDVRVADPSAPTSSAGISIPQVLSLPASGNRIGQLVMNVTDLKYYYYDGAIWVPLVNQSSSIGDIKHSLQANDHDGWIKLDGRATSTLTPSQAARASSLGIVLSIPDASNKFIRQDPVASPGSIVGSNSLLIAVSNLPDYQLTGVTNTAGAHSHPISTRQDDWVLNTFQSSPTSGPSFGRDNGPYAVHHNTNVAGDHAHTVNVSSGGSGMPLPIDPQAIVANAFIYLGQ